MPSFRMRLQYPGQYPEEFEREATSRQDLMNEITGDGAIVLSIEEIHEQMVSSSVSQRSKSRRATMGQGDTSRGPTKRTSAGRSSWASDFMNFRKMLYPIIVKVNFLIGTCVAGTWIVIGPLVQPDMPEGVPLPDGMGLVIKYVLNAVGTCMLWITFRCALEFLMVVFMIHDELRECREVIGNRL